MEKWLHLQFIELSTGGNTQDFGEVTTLAKSGSAAVASSTRACFMGGVGTTGNVGHLTNVIDYITISTTGNATDFGDVSAAMYSSGAVSSKTRAVMMGGYVAPAMINTMEYVTIATRGNTMDFGDLTEPTYLFDPVSNSIRGVRMGGTSPLDTPIDYINIATQGDAVFFGNLTAKHVEGAGCSNAHGGL